MVDWTKSAPNPVDDAVAKMKIAVEDLDGNKAISSADTAELIDQATRLLNAGVVGGVSVVPSTGGGGLLALASGAPAVAIGAPAPTASAPAVDPRLEASASSVGLSVDEFLAQAGGVILGLNNPEFRSIASRGGRATAAASAAAGFIELTERNEPPGTVLSDGRVSAGPPVAIPITGVSQDELDTAERERDTALSNLTAVTAERDTALSNLTAVTTERDTAVTARDNFVAARTALDAAQRMPQGNRRERATRDAAIQAALAQLARA